MKLAILTLVAAAVLLGPSGRTEAAQIAGRDYLRLTDWARANDFDVRWLKRDEMLQLSRRTARLVLAVDSRQASLNGVGVWLSFPIVERNGGVFISQLDSQTTVTPLLSPPKDPAGSVIKTVCLDPGHGGKDPGFSVGSHQEKIYTLLLARELRDQLSGTGLRVSLTRDQDVYVDLSARPAAAKARKADLFVSLHFNSAGSAARSVQGAEVYCLTPPGAPSTNAQGEGGGAGAFAGNRFNDRNTFLAYEIQKALGKDVGVEDRGIKRARYEVLREATMPAVLIEAGFLSHPTEGRRIIDAKYRRLLAHAIADGLLEYKRAVEQRG